MATMWASPAAISNDDARPWPPMKSASSARSATKPLQSSASPSSDGDEIHGTGFTQIVKAWVSRAANS